MLYIPQFNLQKLNTLAVPAMAAYYVKVTDERQLLEAIAFAKNNHLTLLPLGGGSNMVFRSDFDGLVVHLGLKGVEVIREDESSVWMRVAAGENWNDFVNFCVDQELGGVENLALIPGTVGAAPMQNIGAYGVEVEQVIDEVSTVDIESGLPVTFTHAACQFGYRDSVFKSSAKHKYIITNVVFKLSKHPLFKVEYPALNAVLAGMEPIGIRHIRDAVVQVRSEKLPDPLTTPNVGSFFKNPVISMAIFEQIKEKYPDIVYFPVGNETIKLAAGWLIEKAGWKGKSLHDVVVHDKQALVITNPQKKAGADVLALADAIVDEVYGLFGVELEIEPTVIGE